eukprot:8944653-Pyramimonas_sp.AAC.1
MFFEPLCGDVLRLRLLGDGRHPTQIAFVEFNCAASAVAALGCSGRRLGKGTAALNHSTCQPNDKRNKHFNQQEVAGRDKGTPVGVVYRAQGRAWQLGGPASRSL